MIYVGMYMMVPMLYNINCIFILSEYCVLAITTETAQVK
jgi:hypothetical protein